MSHEMSSNLSIRAFMERHAMRDARRFGQGVEIGPSSRRAARIAKEQELAALCRRRASRWADALREGLDPDIARFIRDQAAAWRLLASSYARSMRDDLAKREASCGARGFSAPD